MRRDGFYFQTTAEIFLTVEEVAILMECSANHYDGVCEQAGKPGGFIYGFHNVANFIPGGRPEISVSVSWDKLDTMAKVLEVGQYGPLEQSTAASALHSEVVKLLRHMGRMPKQVRDLLTATARMTKDREIDDSGKICDMTNDDAVETVHSLISVAREILDVPDRPNGDDENEVGEREERESENDKLLEVLHEDKAIDTEADSSNTE